LIDLHYFTNNDIPQLMAWTDTPEFLFQWAGSSLKYPLTAEELEQYVNKANHKNSDVLIYKVVHIETGKSVGHISLGNINRENGTARMCRVLIGDPTMQGKGIGKEMVKKLLTIAFDQLKLHKVSLAVFDFNESAFHLYQKMGFVTEGIIREAYKVGRGYWSYYEMGILDREWEIIKSRRN